MKHGAILARDILQTLEYDPATSRTIVSIFAVQHLGALAVAQPRPSLKDQSVLSATASVFCYPGHKDDIIAKEASEKISSALNRHVTVMLGIHWDDIEDTGITAVIANGQQLMNMIIEKIAAVRGT